MGSEPSVKPEGKLPDPPGLIGSGDSTRTAAVVRANLDAAAFLGEQVRFGGLREGVETDECRLVRLSGDGLAVRRLLHGQGFLRAGTFGPPIVPRGLSGQMLAALASQKVEPKRPTRIDLPPRAITPKWRSVSPNNTGVDPRKSDVSESIRLFSASEADRASALDGSLGTLSLRRWFRWMVVVLISFVGVVFCLVISIAA